MSKKSRTDEELLEWEVCAKGWCDVESRKKTEASVMCQPDAPCNAQM